jgi:glutamate synthase domain-containing protein 3
MSWTLVVTNSTDEGNYPSLTVEVVIESQRAQLTPGQSTTFTGTSGGRMTLNAHPVNRTGIASADAAVNVLGVFSDFTCRVTQTGTALKLQVVSSGA